jgi:DNA-binding CsgD family transcriptional regulator
LKSKDISNPVVTPSTRSGTKQFIALSQIAMTIQRAKDRDSLKHVVATTMVNIFGACRARLVFFDEEPEVVSRLQSSKSALTDLILKSHLPIHEAAIFSSREWQQHNSRHDHGHVMAGPVVGNGIVIGLVALTREKGTTEFTTEDALTLGAICAHISAWKIRTTGISLTKREQEILAHVKSGHSNSQIAVFLKISENGVKQALKRLYRKCDVSTRAQLASLSA